MVLFIFPLDRRASLAGLLGLDQRKIGGDEVESQLCVIAVVISRNIATRLFSSRCRNRSAPPALGRNFQQKLGGFYEENDL